METGSLRLNDTYNVIKYVQYSFHGQDNILFTLHLEDALVFGHHVLQS